MFILAIISAVHASQFESTNAITTLTLNITDFTEVDLLSTTKLPDFKVTVDATTDEVPVWKLSTDNAGTTGVVTLLPTKDGKDYTFNNAAVSPASLIVAGVVPEKIYLTMKEGAATTIIPKEIPIKPAFTFTPVSIDSKKESTASIVVTQLLGDTDWTKEVNLYISKTKGFPKQATKANFAKVTCENTTAGTGTVKAVWTSAALTHTSITDLTKDVPVYMYVVVGDSTATLGTVYQIPGTIAVTEGSAAFGATPMFSLLAAFVLLFVKLF